jgi:hypothetical protein
MAEWNIHKPLGACSGSGQEIEPGEEYIGALVETDQGLERRDFCLALWEQEPPQVFCFWRSRLPHAEQKRQVFVDDEMLVAFFNRLADETDSERLQFRFVLALILMRKRRLKYEGTKMQDGQEIWLLKVTGEKRTVEVLNPHLGEEQIEQLSGQIGEVLNADL